MSARFVKASPDFVSLVREVFTSAAPLSLFFNLTITRRPNICSDPLCLISVYAIFILISFQATTSAIVQWTQYHALDQSRSWSGDHGEKYISI